MSTEQSCLDDKRNVINRRHAHVLHGKITCRSLIILSLFLRSERNTDVWITREKMLGTHSYNEKLIFLNFFLIIGGKGPAAYNSLFNYY